MENLQRLIDVYSNEDRSQKIIGQLSKKDASRIKLSGLIGAQNAFVLTALGKKIQHNQVYIAIDKEEAAYLFNTLDKLTQNINVSFFPDSFKRSAQFEQLDANNILQRTECINRMTTGQGGENIMITYPEALFEKVVDPEILNNQRIEIKQNANIDLDFVIELMIEYGFERVDFVYEPGQFSIRGGIVDIFSFGNEWPYRIELFDEEIESIRMFNPSTQLSIKNLQKVFIIPNVTGQFDNKQKVNVLSILSKNAVIWIKDFSVLIDKIQKCYENALQFISTISASKDEDERLNEIFKDRAFIQPKIVVDELSKSHLLFLNEIPEQFKKDLEVTYNSSPQPSFNRKVVMLSEDMQMKTKQGYENYLFCDNNRQIERFYNIFKDLGVSVQFHAVANSIHSGFVDNDLKVVCYTDHQIFERFHRYKLRKGFTKDQALSLKMIRELQPGDWVVHIDHGIGKYSGLEKININGHIQESVRLVYKNNDLLYVSINTLHKISKYIGKEGTPPKLDRIGSDTWKKIRSKTKKKVKDIARELIKLYAQRRASQGFAFKPDDYLQNELEASFMYEDTPDQYKASEAVKVDMQKEYPMDRLICGDVGFGKTEIAIRAAFKSVVSGKQVAILVPTTILAIQHFKTFSKRLNDFSVSVDYINRFRTSAEKTEIYRRLEEGKIDILIGTHAILNKKITFKDLGLLVIDEEQKFGVSAKEKLRQFKVNVDTLTLTATPIPRTLQFSLMNARDMSIIRTPPPNRQPIHTERRMFNDKLIKEAIEFEYNRGGQVFFVHNRVKSLMDITVMLRKICPDISIQMAHGQMEPKALERTLLDFIDNKFDVLVSTNIIETGLDIPNANTMIINNAHQFGLSDLHQLRGRVGRSNTKAFCYLFAPPLSVLTSEARKRLNTIEEFSDLGSGFNIAMRDMDIRGAGNLLGSEQSGFIADIGYETYQKILDEAIIELKENEFHEEFSEELEKEKIYVHDVDIDTDVEMLFPDDFINSIQERLNLYSELNSISTQEELNKYRSNLKDRFGPIPQETENLFLGISIRESSKKLGFERMVFKNGKLRCFFIKNTKSRYYESTMFKSILSYISSPSNSMNLNLKQTPSYLILIKENVKNLKEVDIILKRIIEDCQGGQFLL